MIEKPILFNTEMVKAIIDGRKTQSRRPIRMEQPPENALPCYDSIDHYQGEGWFFQYDCKISFGLAVNKRHYLPIKGKSPFGQIGDHLYVRETFYPDNDCIIKYKADPLTVLMTGECWKPSIHMPKKYARIWLEITDIRVERVQDISEEEAQKEGFKYEGWQPTYNDPDSGGDGTEVFPVENFFKTWEKIYGKENIWVWVIEFKRTIK